MRPAGDHQPDSTVSEALRAGLDGAGGVLTADIGPSPAPDAARALLAAVADELVGGPPATAGASHALERAASEFAVAVGGVDVAVERLVRLREGLLERAASRLGPAETVAAYARVDAAIDRAIAAVARRSAAVHREEAFGDPLTGLLNRRALERDLPRAIGQAQRYGRELSLVVIDLDGLKALNDTLGHSAGDRALRALAGAVVAHLRGGDQAYRMGGDEFAVVLPETPRQGVPALLERIRASGAPPFSWGAAAVPDDGGDPARLIEAADARLLRSRAPRRPRPHAAARVDPALRSGPVGDPARRWEGRPAGAALVRGAVVAVPVLASVGLAVASSRLLPRPDSLVQTLLWWGAIATGSTAAMAAVEPVARRLLPLATLLRLSMVFPDRAPSRLSLALRCGSVSALRGRVAQLGEGSEPGRAAGEILALVAAVAAYDRHTRGHSERVRAFTELLCEELRLAPAERERLRWAALLHDVGKLAVDPRVLNRAGPLDADEWAAVRRHPEAGAAIAAPLRGWLGEWAAAIEQHHERWDGSGYPGGLAGEQICRGARIVAVADAYEVMTAPRPYKRAMSPRAARAELVRAAGSHFDPLVVRAFLDLSVGRLRGVVGRLALVAQLPVLFASQVLNAPLRLAAASGAAVTLTVAAGLVPVPEPAAPAGRPPASATDPSFAREGEPDPGRLAGEPAESSDTTADPSSTTLAPAAADGRRPPVPPRTGEAPADRPRPATTRPTGDGAPAPPSSTAVPVAVAVDDQATTTARTPVRVNVLANDRTDAGLVPRTLRVVEQPAHGRANVDAVGFVTFVPRGDYVGPVAFDYEVCDDQARCWRARVTVTVTAD